MSAAQAIEIEVGRYTDYRAYIRDRLTKTGIRRSELAARIGMSMSMLSSILSGRKRLRDIHVVPVAELFGLQSDETRLLKALVELENDSARVRRQAWATVLAYRRSRAGETPSAAAVEAASNWRAAAIYELLRCDGFRSDLPWIAATLDPSSTVEEVGEAVDALVAAGLVSRDADGELRPVEVAAPAVAPAGIRAQAMAQLHYATLDLARRSLRAFHTNERHASAGTLSLNDNQVRRIRAILRELTEEIRLLALEPSADPPNRVYHLGSQFFPISTRTDHARSSR